MPSKNREGPLYCVLLSCLLRNHKTPYPVQLFSTVIFFFAVLSSDFPFSIY